MQDLTTSFHKADLIVVEDDPGDAELVRIALATLNKALRVVFFADGRETLSWLDRRKAESDDAPLMLLDLNLPRVSGLEILQRLRSEERHRDITVVVMTSSAREQDRRAALQAGAAEVLTKEVVFDKFLQVLDRLISQYVRTTP